MKNPRLCRGIFIRLWLLVPVFEVEPEHRSDALQCDITTLLTKRTFVGGRSDGTITDLTLKPWGVWLPDTAKKPKKRKRKSDGDECDCDID